VAFFSTRPINITTANFDFIHSFGDGNDEFFFNSDAFNSKDAIFV
jgi:hypothetical protein